MLTQAALDCRRGKVTASDAREIMNARCDADLLHHWEVKLELAPPQPENYAMRCGTAMEPVIIAERERQTGETVTRRQEVVDHPTIKDFMCTLDGWEARGRRVVEVKFCSAFMAREDIFRIYYPQVAFQMACTDADSGALVVGQGTSEPFEIECVRDAAYEAELLQRCSAFLLCMKTLQPPAALPLVVPPEKWRTVDLSVEAPNWADELECLLFVYSANKPFAEQHEEAGRLARALIPDDVGKVIARDFTLSRNKRGTVAITRRAA